MPESKRNTFRKPGSEAQRRCKTLPGYISTRDDDAKSAETDRIISDRLRTFQAGATDAVVFTNLLSEKEKRYSYRYRTGYRVSIRQIPAPKPKYRNTAMPTAIMTPMSATSFPLSAYHCPAIFNMPETRSNESEAPACYSVILSIEPQTVGREGTPECSGFFWAAVLPSVLASRLLWDILSHICIDRFFLW